MRIYIQRDQQRFGPYTKEQMEQFLVAGNVRPTDLAWAEGTASWQSVSELLGPEALPPAVRRETATVYPKPSFGRRLVAYVIDSVISLLMIAPGVVLTVIGAGTEEGSLLAVGILILVLGLVAGLGYMLVRDGNERGAGIGKRAMGQMVVHLRTNMPATKGQSAIRYVVLLLTGFVPLVGWLIEPIAALVDPAQRRLGDKAADTQVIEAEDWRPEGG